MVENIQLVLGIQSNSAIVESIIVENLVIVDNLPWTEDFYLIKIQNSRNSKIVEGLFWKGRVILVFFPLLFYFISSNNVFRMSLLTCVVLKK